MTTIRLLATVLVFITAHLMKSSASANIVRSIRSMATLSQGAGRTRPSTVIGSLRVLQYNVLADGLSGLRPDLGGFSRVDKSLLSWSARKDALLTEMQDYAPDIITLQECDHFHDFFEPELRKLRYKGVFAPKPASACLEVSDKSDGCAVFVKAPNLRLVSTETLTYALPQHLTWDEAVRGTEHRDEALSRMLYSDRQNLWKFLRVQNQVALINVCEVSRHGGGEPVPIIVATTHLKATKTARGERLRYWEAQQLLAALERTCADVLARTGARSVPVVLTGDLNACPTPSSTQFGFNNTVYPLIKRHPLGFRSVMNDDLPLALSGGQGVGTGSEGGEVWTTWKARRKGDKEVVVRHCIDYILYGTAHAHRSDADEHSREGDDRHLSPSEGANRRRAVRAVAALQVPSDEQVGQALLPSALFPSDHLPLVADLQIMQET